jgi:RimJ/RimL family protein N-acetyltransferase
MQSDDRLVEGSLLVPAIPILQTAHLLLRPWTLEDAPRLFEIMQEEDIFKYFPPAGPPTLDKARRYISHHLAHWREHGYGHWAVVIAGEGQLVGWNGLEYLPDTDETEVAYLLSHVARGKGYATEAARAAVQYGLQTSRLDTIIGLVHEQNLPSIRVLEKCGLSFIDEKIYFGMEMRRYRIERSEYERPDRYKLGGQYAELHNMPKDGSAIKS